ncbi:retrovirus-related pol polyprotein from transposon TNT 1-94 [Tanacetum coccineum]
MEAIMIFLAYAIQKSFIVFQIDVRTAFLHDLLKEDVYVCQPKGFIDADHPSHVYKLKKALYGLNYYGNTKDRPTVVSYGVIRRLRIEVFQSRSIQDYLKAKDQDMKIKSQDIKLKIKIQDHKHAEGSSKEFLRPQGSKIQEVTRSEAISAMSTP